MFKQFIKVFVLVLVLTTSIAALVKYHFQGEWLLTKEIVGFVVGAVFGGLGWVMIIKDD